MPIFEFVCASCGKSFEEIIAANAKFPPCPACGSTSVEKILSTPCVVQSGTSHNSGKVNPLNAGGGKHWLDGSKPWQK